MNNWYITHGVYRLISPQYTSKTAAKGTLKVMPSSREKIELNAKASIDKSWVVYIIISSDDKLYTGISNNPAKRWHAHNHTKQAAKFFRGRSPKKLAYLEQGHNRSSASRREAHIKKLSRQKKLQLLDSQSALDWHLELGLSQS